MRRQRMNTIIVTGSVLGALAAFTGGCGPQAGANGGGGGAAGGGGTASEGQIAPDIALPLKKGAAPVALSSWKGKVVLVDFWATWCGPCRQSIPEVERVYEKYHAKGLEVVGISVDEAQTAAEVPAAVKELKMTYPVVLYSDIPDIRTKYVFDGIPQMYLIDKKGNISQSIPGFDPSGNLDAKVEALLNAKD